MSTFIVAVYFFAHAALIGLFWFSVYRLDLNEYKWIQTRAQQYSDDAVVVVRNGHRLLIASECFSSVGFGEVLEGLSVRERCKRYSITLL